MNITELGIDVAKKANLSPVSINSDIYYFESGMTWGDWITSKYNIDGFYIDSMLIRTKDGKFLTDGADVGVFSSDKIDTNIAYDFTNRVPMT